MLQLKAGYIYGRPHPVRDYSKISGFRLSAVIYPVS